MQNIDEVPAIDGLYGLLPNVNARVEEEYETGILPINSRLAAGLLFLVTVASAYATTTVLERGPVLQTAGPDFGEPKIEYVNAVE